MASRTPFWNSNFHAERRAFLLGRAEIVRALRDQFAQHEFIEVDTAALQYSPGNETHLQAFKTELQQPGRRDRRYLRTSPEFACKKLLAAGERRIVEFAKVFRNGERGPLHHPEFTLIEWYRAHGHYEMMMEDCLALIGRAAEAVDSQRFQWRERIADPFANPERITVAEAFQVHADIDILATIKPEGPDHRMLALRATRVGVHVMSTDSWGDMFSRILVEKVEPYLGLGRPTILDEYPSAMSALARPKEDDPRVSERFEIYMCGVELANGFGELTDAHEQRRRLAAQMDEKERIYKERYPIDDDFISALRMMPLACGVAMGLDRLVMLATGATHIEQVMWTPIPEL